MKKIISLFRKEYIIIIMLVIISLFPLYSPGFFKTHDGIIHLYRTVGVYENIKNLDFFNKIYYNMLNGDGYGWGIFYPPLSAIIPAIFMCIGFSLFTAEKIYLILFSILSGIFSYKLFKELFKDDFISLICSILYILAPYRINQIFIRGSMGEVALFTFLPLVILGIIKILKKEYKYKYYFIFGAIGIVYSHTISTIYTAIFGVLLIISFAFIKNMSIFNKKTIWEFFKCIIIIALISTPILFPMLQHKNLEIYKISNSDTDVASQILYPGQLIGGAVEPQNILSTSYYSDEKEMNYMIGLTSIIILTLLPFVYKSLKNNGEFKYFIIWSILLVIAIVMMITPFFWNKIEFLDTIQFPWRLLNFAVMFITILAGFIIKEIVTNENKFSMLIFVISFSMIFVYMIGSKVEFEKNLNNEYDFYSQEITEQSDYGDITVSTGYSIEYSPICTDVDKIIKKGTNIDVLSGDANITGYSNDKNILKFNVENKSENTLIEISRIYYLGYEVLVDENVVEYSMSENGFIQFEVGDTGNHTVSIRYTGTRIYRILDIVAIVIFLLYLGWISIFKGNKDNILKLFKHNIV